MHLSNYVDTMSVQRPPTRDRHALGTVGERRERKVRVMQVSQITSCCDPLLDAALDEPQAKDLAAMFKVLADPVRLRLLSLIANAPDGRLCACDLPMLVDRKQPTVSHHLSILVDAGLLVREPAGKWAWFHVVPERLAVLRDALDDSGTPADIPQRPHASDAVSPAP